jgi:hypothetical protein
MDCRRNLKDHEKYFFLFCEQTGRVDLAVKKDGDSRTGRGWTEGGGHKRAGFEGHPKSKMAHGAISVPASPTSCVVERLPAEQACRRIANGDPVRMSCWVCDLASSGRIAY